MHTHRMRPDLNTIYLRQVKDKVGYLERKIGRLELPSMCCGYKTAKAEGP